MAVIANGEDSRVRDLIKSGRYTDFQIQGNLTAVIGEVMIAYCGATSDGTHIGIFNACAELMVHKYNEMSLEEIREAFRLAAINEIDADITAYKGVATVAIFGNVMSKYKDYRRKYVAEILRVKEIEDRERMQEDGHGEKKAQYEQMVIDWFNDALKSKGALITSYGQIPVYYYNTLDELGKLNVDIDIKKVYFELAIEQYAEALKMKESKEISDKRFIGNLIQNGFKDVLINLEKDKKLDVTNLAKRLLLYAIIKGDVKHNDVGTFISREQNNQPPQE